MSGGKPAGYGGRLAGQALNPFRGTASMDVSGNLVIDDGSKLLFAGITATPHIARESDPTTGITIIASGINSVVGGNTSLRVTSTAVEVSQTLKIEEPVVFVPGAQTITASGQTLASSVPALHLTLTGNYTVSNCVAGSDGQILSIENESGTFGITLDRLGAAGTRFFLNTATMLIPTNQVQGFVYSTTRGGWIQSTWDFSAT